MAERLRNLRKLAGLTQTELARRTGIHRTLIARYESGLTIPSATKIVRIAAAIGCMVEDLIRENDTITDAEKTPH